MNDNIKNCETLDDLFKAWEDNYHNIFCPDGYIDVNTFNIQEKKILFIAKESNTSKDDDKKSTFWLKDVYLGIDGTSHTILSNRISMMANAYFDESDFYNINKNHDILKNIAYMNINKRGGSNRTKASDLRKYAVRYKDYIKREIELIDPGLIVCCSGLVYDIITKNIDFESNQPHLICVYHPSYYRISDKEYLKRFYNECLNEKVNVNIKVCVK